MANIVLHSGEKNLVGLKFFTKVAKVDIIEKLFYKC